MPGTLEAVLMPCTLPEGAGFVAGAKPPNPIFVRAGLQCLQLCADALCSCDLSPLSALTDLRALALTSHNDKQRCAVPPSVLGARGVLSTCGVDNIRGQHAPATMTAALCCAALWGWVCRALPPQAGSNGELRGVCLRRYKAWFGGSVCPASRP